jgi:hypothetical protein
MVLSENKRKLKMRTREDSGQQVEEAKKFQLGHLGSLNQVVKALGKTIRAMADGTIDSQLGARICNGLGIMRACLETATLDRLEERLGELQGEVDQRGSYGISTNHRAAIGAHRIVS